MRKVTWPARDVSLLGAVDPHRFALDASGRRVGFVRELATMDGYRVCLFPDGNHSEAVEGRVMFGPAPWPRDDETPIAEQEAFVIKMATRWLLRRL